MFDIFTVIGWKKRTFRKHFDSEENYTEFHKKASRILEAPTIAITHKLQDLIEEWLKSVKEMRAAVWWREYWTGEHGNYTNATCGYVGNNKSTSIESHWRYMRRDIVGNSGINKRISLRVFAPSLTQYMSDTSKRHADKILDSKTGAHRFPVLPTISTSMWSKVQKFNLMRLLLSISTGSKAVQKQWDLDLDYFHYSETEGKLFTDIIQSSRAAGMRMKVPRTSLDAILMPTARFIKTLRVHFGKAGKPNPTFEEYYEEVVLTSQAYKTLFNEPDQFHLDYPQYDVDDVLDLMESFDCIKPLAIRTGDQVFLCTCCDAYQKYCCVESTVLSLLYNTELDVPDIARLKEIKEREKAERANPWNSKRLKEKKRKDDKKKTEVQWKPIIPVFTDRAPGSAADLANQRGKLVSRTVPDQHPSSVEDPLQRPVDPKLLVASGAKGPPKHRHNPALKEKKKVHCIHFYHVLCLTTPHGRHPRRHSLLRLSWRSSATRELSASVLRPSRSSWTRARREKRLRGEFPFPNLSKTFPNFPNLSKTFPNFPLFFKKFPNFPISQFPKFIENVSQFPKFIENVSQFPNLTLSKISQVVVTLLLRRLPYTSHA